MNYKAIVIGASTGGFYALKRLITALPGGFEFPILIVQHISSNSDNFMARYLDGISKLTVKEADEKEAILPGTVYIAPPNYHMLVEENFTIGLSTEEKIRYARPSIDVLFESAVYAYGNQLIGLLLKKERFFQELCLCFHKDDSGTALLTSLNNNQKNSITT